MAKVQFRNKTSEELACFIGHNGWRVVQPDEVIEVDDDDVVTPPVTAVGGEIKSVDPEEQGGTVHYYERGDEMSPAHTSADAYRLAADQWAEVGVAAPAPPPPPPPPPTDPPAGDPPEGTPSGTEA